MKLKINCLCLVKSTKCGQFCLIRFSVRQKDSESNLQNALLIFGLSLIGHCTSPFVSLFQILASIFSRKKILKRFKDKLSSNTASELCNFRKVLKKWYCFQARENVNFLHFEPVFYLIILVLIAILAPPEGLSDLTTQGWNFFVVEAK